MAEYVQERTQQQPENPFASLIPHQTIAIIPSFTLESGVTLHNVPLAYSTRGKLSPNRDNAMVICHALTGSADVSDWWGPLLGGPGRAFDISRFFVICMNSLGSPYGSASPVTSKDGNPKNERYGPEFPLTTIRDDVKYVKSFLLLRKQADCSSFHKLLLDDLGVGKVAVVIGGSMGGMLVLEWAYFGKDYVRSIVPIATSSRHSAWGISWGEAQRQSIYADPKYDDGYYSFSDPPSTGLGAARMSALLTYRSRNSFEARFGRNTPEASKKQTISEPQTPSSIHLAIHNDGHRSSRAPLSRPGSSSDVIAPKTNGNSKFSDFTDPQFHGATPLDSPSSPKRTTSTYFSAQSYLRYQGEKFVKRFDGNCYIAITRKLDTHDVSRYRVSPESTTPIADALAQIEQPTLVLGIESDGLFMFDEQKELAASIPNARLRKIDSPEGHDAFLLQFEQVNQHILHFLREVLPDIMEAPGSADIAAEDGVGVVTKNSTFGEAEVEDITAW